LTEANLNLLSVYFKVGDKIIDIREKVKYQLRLLVILLLLMWICEEYFLPLYDKQECKDI
jgi:hypothetical protein